MAGNALQVQSFESVIRAEGVALMRSVAECLVSQAKDTRRGSELDVLLSTGCFPRSEAFLLTESGYMGRYKAANNVRRRSGLNRRELGCCRRKAEQNRPGHVHRIYRDNQSLTR